MTRFKISIVVLILILLLSIGSTIAVRCAGNSVLREVQMLSEASPTLEQCDAIEAAWKKAEPWLMLVVRRDKVMTTATSLYRLKPLLEADCDEFGAERCNLQNSLESLMEEEGFSLRRLF